MQHGFARDLPVPNLLRVVVVLALITGILVIAAPAQGAAVSGAVDFVVGTSNAPEGTAVHTIDVSLTVGATNTLDADFSVDVAVATPSGTAANPADYTYSTTTVTFIAGEDDTAIRQVNIGVVGDSLDEAAETIELELTNLVNTTGLSALGSTTTHQVTITDDDPTPTLAIEAAPSATEGSPVSFDVTLSAISGQTVTVNYATANGTATTADSDYTAVSSSFTFTPGQTTKTINVTTGNDTRDEPNENFTVSLSSPSNATIAGGQGTGTGTINDNDPTPSLSITNASPVTEGANSSFTVSLSAASGRTVTVSYATQSGTATSGSDFTAAANTLTFTPGQTSKPVLVSTTSDGVSEPTETFTVQLSGESNATISDSSGTGTINDGTALPSLSIEATPSATEGSQVSFDVTLSAISAQTVTVNYASANGTATTGDSDYTAVSNSLTFTPTQTTKTINVNTGNDSKDENNENFTVTLSSPSNATIAGGQGTGTGTITDNDAPPTLAISDSSVLEDVGTMTFNVNLSAASGKTVQVNYATLNGTATTADNDYTSTSGTLTFNPNDTLKQISVPIGADSRDEFDERFTVTLSVPIFATIADGSATGDITDDDAPPVLSVDSVQLEEGITQSFTVALSTASAKTITTNYQTVNGSAIAPGDYTSHALTLLTFTPGQTSKTVNVTTADDGTNEANETFTVVLSGWSPTASVPDADGVGTILDNDGAPGLSVLDATPTSEDGTGMEFSVVLLPASGQTVTVDYATADGTAVAGADYTATTGQLTFDPEVTIQTVPVPIINDGLDEIDEAFTLNLSNAPLAGIADGEGLGEIVDANNVVPTASISITDLSGAPAIEFTTGEQVRISVSFVDPGTVDPHNVTVDWGDGTPPEVFAVTPLGGRSFDRMHSYTSLGLRQISVSIADDVEAGLKTGLVSIVEGGLGGSHRIALVSPWQSIWYLFGESGDHVTQFYYGNPFDYPFMGDWDGDGIETPGLFRQSDGFAYLRNSNTQGPADVSFFFGNPGDIPIAGDFNDDGKDTVSIYRPSNATFYIINKLGPDGGSLGAAEIAYVFGNPGDKPFVGDFDGDGVETVGLHRESTGLVYFRNSHSQGNADAQFIFGDPGDGLVAGDWTGNGVFSPSLFRPSDTTMYFKHDNTQGNADSQFVPVPNHKTWIPVSGITGF